MVGNEMLTFATPIEHVGYTARPLSEVWKSNGGTELEKALLLNEMIKHSGIESKILLTFSSEMYDKELGNMKDFGHYTIMVHIANEDIIISTNPAQANNLAFGLVKNILIDKDANLVNLPDFIAELDPSVMAKGEFQINDSGDVTGKFKLSLKGAKSPYLNYMDKLENANQIAHSL